MLDFSGVFAYVLQFLDTSTENGVLFLSDIVTEQVMVYFVRKFSQTNLNFVINLNYIKFSPAFAGGCNATLVVECKMFAIPRKSPFV